jgi:Uma2 family endonuclease
MSTTLTPAPAPTAPPATALAYRLPLQGLQAGFRRFSVVEYHRLIASGVLTADDNVELLDGYLVHKISRTPPHDSALQLLLAAFPPRLPGGWTLRVQSAVTLSASEPEPDGAVVRGGPRTYAGRHPGPADCGLIIEVADSTLAADRADKGALYGEAGIPQYWLINLVDRQVEVYTLPSGPGLTPGYASRQDYRPGSAVSLILAGAQVAMIPVADLLP